MGRRLQLAFTVLAIGLIAWLVDWTRFDDLVRAADPRLLLLAAFLFAADRLLMSYKWKLLIDAQGTRVPLLEILGAVLVGDAGRHPAAGDGRR